MGKIIKRKVQRSIPWLVIFSLLASLTVGFSFNINFDFVRGNEKGFISIGQDAQADTASTTVEVRNAAPYFQAGNEPEEDPASASTSPVNIGGSIDFKGTGSDPEGDDYYLLICTTNSATANLSGAPTCGGAQLCVSDIASSSEQASCTYSGLTDPGSETQVWYGFVCDYHATSPGCSASSQGIGTASGSPVYVNHYPYLSSVSTTVDDQDPGGTFTIEAVVADSDVSGSADEINLAICTTNSFTGFSCDDTTICTGTSTSPNVTCQYTDTAPTPDTDYTYYAFVYDWHGLQATSTASSTYTINNVYPNIGSGSVILNGGVNITLNIKDAPGVVVYATSTSITDNNGCTDLVGATSTIYLSGATGGANCSGDDNDCYIITSCALSDCSGPTDATATYTCTTSMEYHTIPTDAGTYMAMSWHARITAFDEATASSSSYVGSGVQVSSNAALGVNEAQIDFGIVDSNSNTGAWNASTTVVNFGNTPLDTGLQATDDMLRSYTGPEEIDSSEQEFSTSTFVYGAGINMSSTSPYTLNVEISRPTTTVADVSDIIWWGINIPLGTVSGNYYGQNVFTAIEDADGNWN